MAVTKIHRIHSTLNLALKYITNGAKTEEQTLLSSFACSDDPDIAAHFFMQRNAKSSGNTLAHHMIQSFLPGEVDAETAHRIGVELADQFLDGKHQYVMSTHVDKGHIHNHIIFNAINLTDGSHYWAHPKNIYRIREISDKLCKEHGLYVIPPSPDKGKSYYEYIQAKQGTSYKAKLKETIDKVLTFCKDYEDLIRQLQQHGYEIKRGKYISVRTSDQERFTRIKTLGQDYTEEALIERIRSKARPFPFKKPNRNAGKIIESNEHFENSPGLEKWRLLQNLTTASQEMIQMEKYGLSSLEELSSLINDTATSMDSVRRDIVKIEDRMKHLTVAMEYVKSYKENLPVYKQYKNAKDKELFLRKHETEIAIFESVSKQLKEMGYNKLPALDTLKKEYDSLASEKPKLEAAYQEKKSEVAKLTSVQKNLQKFLDKDIQKTKRKKRNELD